MAMDGLPVSAIEEQSWGMRGVARVITRDEVQRLVADESAQILDVLPRAEYDEEHIAAALSLPLKELDANTAAQADATRPVITYCHDSL